MNIGDHVKVRGYVKGAPETVAVIVAVNENGKVMLDRQLMKSLFWYEQWLEKVSV